MYDVSTIVRSDLLIYCLIIDVVLLIYFKLNYSKNNYSIRLLKCIVLSITIVTIFEIVSWMTGEIGNTAQIPIHYISNALFLTFTGLPAAFGLSYLDYKIFNDEKRNKKKFFIYLFPTYIALIFTIINFFSDGFFFTIAQNNQYHRGVGVVASLITIYIFFVSVLIYFWRYKKMITGRVLQSIIIFFFTPILGSLLQTLAYGTTFGMPSYTLAALIVFLVLGKDDMSKDDLTDLYTRSKLAERLKFKLKNAQPFTVIMLDLDGFKKINDSYGHAEGDKVLIVVSEILRKAINLEDTICRYGGDEFLILIEHENNIAGKVIDRITRAFDKFNQSVEYNIYFSYGYEFVENPVGIDSEELLRRVDEKMYKNKDMKKAKSSIK